MKSQLQETCSLNIKGVHLATPQIQGLYITRCLKMFSALPAVCVFVLVLVKQWSCENLLVNLPYHAAYDLLWNSVTRYPDKKRIIYIYNLFIRVTSWHN